MKQYLSYFYDNGKKSWLNSGGKLVFTYDRIESNAVHSKPYLLSNNIKITQTSHWIQFKGSELTGVTIYNLIGEIVAAVKQPACSAIKIELSNAHGDLITGKYITELTCKSGKHVFPIIVNR